MTGTRARIAAAVGAATLAVIVAAAPVQAHTALRSASPKPGSTVRSPAQIVLTYQYAVRLSEVMVVDKAARHYESGKPSTVDNTVTQKVRSNLPDGTYTVAWRVTSPDGHPVAGAYYVTVNGSTGTAVPAPVSAAQPAAAGTGGTSGTWWVILGVAAAGAVAAALMMRRRTAQR